VTTRAGPTIAPLTSECQERTAVEVPRRSTRSSERAACTSFEDGYSWLLPFAYNVGYRFRGGDKYFADDVAQEAMTRAFVAWPRVRSHPKPEAWITVTAFRVALELDRKQRRSGRPTSISTSTEPNEDQRLADAELLAQAMKRLSARQQQVVVWRYYFDQSIQQTAQRLRLSESKVKDISHQAVTKLARIMSSNESTDVIRRPTARSPRASRPISGEDGSPGPVFGVELSLTPNAERSASD
jgi:RNA polymerase sigma-70 factor (ECF subfamily)